MRSTPDRTSRARDGRRASARRETYSSPASLKPWALGLRGRYWVCSFGVAPLGRSVQSVLRGASHALDRVAGNTGRDYAIGHSISHSPTASGRNEQTAAVKFFRDARRQLVPRLGLLACHGHRVPWSTTGGERRSGSRLADHGIAI